MGLQRRQIRALYEAWGPMVHRRARAILGNDADAEEAVQEVFIRALNGVERFRKDSQISTWLYRITTNYCLNKIRDAKRRRELWDEKVESELPSSVGPRAHADILAIRRVMAEADPEQAAAAVYVYVDGLSHKEASKLLNVSRRTVGNLLDRFDAFAKELLTTNEAPN